MKGDSVQNAKIRHMSGKKSPTRSRDPDYLSIQENRQMKEVLRNWKPREKREDKPDNA